MTLMPLVRMKLYMSLICRTLTFVCMMSLQVLDTGDSVFGISLENAVGFTHPKSGGQQMQSDEPDEVVLHGRITRKRWFSSRLFFFDVSSPSSDESPSEASIQAFVGEKLQNAARLPCIYRQGAVHDRGVLGAADVVELANELSLGDWVRIRYRPNAVRSEKGERSVQVKSLQVLTPWKSSHPGQAAWDSDSCPAPTVVSEVNKRRAPKGEICKFWVNR